MKNRNTPINFVHYDRALDDYTGLTKREYAAIKIMAGFAADLSASLEADISDVRAVFVKGVAICAIEWADALFNELDKTKT